MTPERTLRLSIVAKHGAVEGVVNAKEAQVSLQNRLPVNQVEYLPRSWSSGEQIMATMH